jgi:hypothetical protein
MENYDKKPDLQVNQSSGGSGTTIGIVVAALVLVVGAFLYFSSSPMTTEGQKVTQNNTALPAPVIEEPATPVPATPPASAEPPAQSATPPATPPADAPATNP